MDVHKTLGSVMESSFLQCQQIKQTDESKDSQSTIGAVVTQTMVPETSQPTPFSSEILVQTVLQFAIQL